ncbi:MAG: hypothetical protein ACYCYO_02735 [Bacilli bacterium]
MSRIKRWWLPGLIVIFLLAFFGFWYYTSPLISPQQALKIANSKLHQVGFGSHNSFDQIGLIWYDNGRLFSPHRVYLATGLDNSRITTTSYIQAMVDARTGKVIAIYNIDYPYMTLFSGASLKQVEQIAENFSKNRPH